MPTFSYKAINENGNTVAGTLEAQSSEEATSIIVARNLIPEKINMVERKSTDSLSSKMM